MTARLLAIDTATDQLAVALCTPAGQWCRNAPGGALSSAALLPLVLQLLADADLRMADLDAVAFGAGPGAFTGLRTACAAAQGLALGVGCPVLPIDSLMLVAEDARHRACAGAPSSAQATAPDGWWVAVDARMDEVYAAQYRWQAGATAGWQVLLAPALYTWAALAEVWRQTPPQQVAGNACTVFADRLPLAGVACQSVQHNRAEALMRLARQAWSRGGADGGIDPADALPVYLRDKVALTTAERAAAA